MDWDLTTIEHHKDCPWGDNCALITKEVTGFRGDDSEFPVCVWCFTLAQAEFTSNHIRDLVADKKESAVVHSMHRNTQAGLRWDQYGD